MVCSAKLYPASCLLNPPARTTLQHFPFKNLSIAKTLPTYTQIDCLIDVLACQTVGRNTISISQKQWKLKMQQLFSFLSLTEMKNSILGRWKTRRGKRLENGYHVFSGLVQFKPDGPPQFSRLVKLRKSCQVGNYVIGGWSRLSRSGSGFSGPVREVNCQHKPKFVWLLGSDQTNQNLTIFFAW